MLSTRGLTFATVAVAMHGRAVIRVPAQREIYNFPSLPHGIDLMQPGRVAQVTLSRTYLLNFAEEARDSRDHLWGEQHPDGHDEIECEEREDETDPSLAVVSGKHHVEIAQDSRAHHEEDVDDDKDEKVHQSRVVHPAHRALGYGANPALSCRPGVRETHSRQYGNWRGNEHGDEVGEQLDAVIRNPRVLRGPVECEVLETGAQSVRQNIP